jgi:hypothetical protein
MSSWEPQRGATDEWYTPQWVFDQLGLVFDLDPCSAGWGKDNVPALMRYDAQMDGLAQPWHGMVWMNPPFGGRNGVVPWLERFVDHGNGVGLVRAYTSAGWFHDWVPKCDALLFPRGKTRFIRPDGTEGGCPGTGVVFLACGPEARMALRRIRPAIWCSL